MSARLSDTLEFSEFLMASTAPTVSASNYPLDNYEFWIAIAVNPGAYF